MAAIDSKQLRKYLTRSQRVLDRVISNVKVAEGVYFNVVNVPAKQLQLVDRSKVNETGNVLWLDLSLSMLEPSKWYLSLLESIGVSKDECIAKIQDFTFHQRKDGKFVVFPNVRGGSYNPYIKYKSNRSSASRRMRAIESLSRIVNKKVFMINLNLTYPKEISKALFEDPHGQEKSQRVLDSFLKEAFGSEYAFWSNEHLWGSVYPFNPHDHIHLLFPNIIYVKRYHCSYNNCDGEVIFKGKKIQCKKCRKFTKFKKDIKIRKKFIRINPYFKEERIAELQQIWYSCMKAELKLESNNGTVYGDLNYKPEKINIWLQYFNGFKADLTGNISNDRARSKIVHTLKYVTRSYLVDVGKFFDYGVGGSESRNEVSFLKYENYHKKQFKRFVKLGCIQNKTRVRGYLTRLKEIVRELDDNKNNLYYNCFLKKDRLTALDPVTSKPLEKSPNNCINFSDMSSLAVWMGYKTKLVKLATIYFKQTDDEDRGKNQKLKCK